MSTESKIKALKKRVDTLEMQVQALKLCVVIHDISNDIHQLRHDFVVGHYTRSMFNMKLNDLNNDKREKVEELKAL